MRSRSLVSAATRRLLCSMLVACMGCGSPEPSEPSEPMVTLRLENISVTTAVRGFAEAAHTPVVVDPAAARFGSCSVVTLLVPDERPASEVGALLAAALHPHGFELVSSEVGWRLTHAGAAPPGCESAIPPAPTAAAPTDVPVTITRAERDAWVADGLTPARFAPHLGPLGGIDGFRMFAIRSDTMLAHLGFQNGDTVHVINERFLTSEAVAREALAQLRDEPEYRVLMTRRSETFVHVIRVVD